MFWACFYYHLSLAPGENIVYSQKHVNKKLKHIETNWHTYLGPRHVVRAPVIVRDAVDAAATNDGSVDATAAADGGGMCIRVSSTK